jgi:2-keto-4-pentenoate hydratase/2-oxohepta-3-ene-1,7-dioic acid hydratase in catechol pathway
MLPMKLATFAKGGRTGIGVIDDGQIVDLAVDSRLPVDMIGLLAAGEPALEAARSIHKRSTERIPLSHVRLEAPVLSPRKFLALGGSYGSHLAEVAHLGIPYPTNQTWFNKQVTCINGPYDDIHLPRVSATLDYEGELAIIIGKRGRHLRGASASAAIAGFTICNDVSVREWQRRAVTGTIGKSFDTHGPLGPWMVTADELPNANNLWLKTWVNGELRQDGNTNDLIYAFEDMLAELSTSFTLEPGDILSTGTPAGVGVVRNPPQFLKAGDVCRVEIEGIGYIENRVAPEP